MKKRVKNFQQLSRAEACEHATPVVNHEQQRKRQNSREYLITWPGPKQKQEDKSSEKVIIFSEVVNN